jgi:hypothetical protein
VPALGRGLRRAAWLLKGDGHDRERRAPREGAGGASPRRHPGCLRRRGRSSRPSRGRSVSSWERSRPGWFATSPRERRPPSSGAGTAAIRRAKRSGASSLWWATHRSSASSGRASRRGSTRTREFPGPVAQQMREGGIRRRALRARLPRNDLGEAGGFIHRRRGRGRRPRRCGAHQRLRTARARRPCGGARRLPRAREPARPRDDACAQRSGTISRGYRPEYLAGRGRRYLPRATLTVRTEGVQ